MLLISNNGVGGVIFTLVANSSSRMIIIKVKRCLYDTFRPIPLKDRGVDRDIGKKWTILLVKLKSVVIWGKERYD